MSDIEEARAQARITIYAQSWARQRRLNLRRNIGAQNLIATRTLHNSVKYLVDSRSGITDRIAFTFKRYGFIKAAGISQSYRIRPSQIMPAQQPQDFITPALNPHIKSLADYVAAQEANARVKQVATGFTGKTK